MRLEKISAIFLCWLVSLVVGVESEGIAATVDKTAYDYPYKNPYLATTTVAILKGRDDPAGGPVVNLRMRIFKDRKYGTPLEGKGKLRFRLYRQEKPSPLVFIIPGLASSAYTGSALYLADLFWDQGFHVLVLPSPFNWNFALAASRSGVPGFTPDDSKDLYAVMEKSLDYVIRRFRIEVGKVGVLGISDGALYVAHIGELDASEEKIGIDTLLLVNPPVDRLAAIKRIDQLAEPGSRVTKEQAEAVRAYAFGVAVDALQGDVDAPDYFSDWDRRLRLSEKQMKFLIGQELRSAAGDAIYVIDHIHELDVLEMPLTRGYRSRRLEEARGYSLKDYVSLILLPRLGQTGQKPMTLATLNAKTSLKAARNILQKKRNIFLMHNADDFLISRSDLTYLQRIFGDRATIYPHGGHLGNLWYPRNRQDMLNIFRPLLQRGP